ANDVKGVARELGADQVLQRHRDLFRRLEAAPERHRPGKVDHHHRGGLGLELGLPDLEVVLRELDWELGALTAESVHDRPVEVEVEGIAELVALGVVGAVDALTGVVDLVLAGLLFLELSVDLAEGFLADLAGAARRELPGVAALADVAGVLEDLEEFL